MMTREDIDRITNSDKKIERLITNAVKACENSTSDWAKDFWFNTFKTLCTKYNRTDLYNRHLH